MHLRCLRSAAQHEMACSLGMEGAVRQRFLLMLRVLEAIKS